MGASYQPPDPNPRILERLRHDAEIVWGAEVARALADLLIEAATELTIVDAAALDPTTDWPELEPPWPR